MTTNLTPLEQTVAKIRECRSFAITSHLRPDGDSLCTSLALALALEGMGRTAEIVNTDNVPVPFDAFPAAARIRTGQIRPGVHDAVILLECADVSRSGQTGIDGSFKINIDHHYSNDRYADINWVEPEASAVGELGYDLCRALPAPLTPEIANLLYCAIVSDTGSFQFSNTTARAFGVSRELVAAGANPIAVSEALYHNHRPEKIKLLGRVLSTLRILPGGEIAVISMFLRDLAELGLREVDTEDITTLVRSIRGIRAVLFFKEMEPGVFRVSIRSKGPVHAARIAEHFGGGGHAHAAGFTVTGPFRRLVRDVPATVERLLRSTPSPDAAL